MKALLPLAVAGLLLAAAATEAPAQAMRGPGRFDFGVYAGPAWTSAWLEAGGHEFSTGWNPVFGGFATFWAAPRLGVRAHLGYLRSGLPAPADPELVQIEDRRLHSWIYDLNLVARPFLQETRPSTALSTLYFFLGAGAFTANPAGGDPEGCASPYYHGNACLANDWRNATVGQITAGTGLGFLPLTPALGLFTELGVHLFDSPFHIGPQWTGREPCPNPSCLAQDLRMTAVRLVGGLHVALGPAPPPPPPPPPVRPVPPPPPPPLPREEMIRLCIPVEGVPQYFDLVVRPETGDTLVITAAGERQPISALSREPVRTASGLPWFVSYEDIQFQGHRYVPFGLSRTVEPGGLRRVGEFRGVPVFAYPDGQRPAQPGRPAFETIYLPLDDGCIFQPYQPRQELRPRGD